jgi:hypothetical protein
MYSGNFFFSFIYYLFYLIFKDNCFFKLKKKAIQVYEQQMNY